MAGVDVLQESYPREDMDLDEVPSDSQTPSTSRRVNKRKTASGFDASLIDFQDVFDEDSDSDYAAERTSAKRNITQPDASQVTSKDEEEYLASILLMIKTCDSLPAVLLTQGKILIELKSNLFLRRLTSRTCGTFVSSESISYECSWSQDSSN